MHYSLSFLNSLMTFKCVKCRSSHFAFRFVDEIVARLEQKRRLELKYVQLEHLSAQRQVQSGNEIRQAQELLEGVVEAAKTLQEEVGCF